MKKFQLIVFSLLLLTASVKVYGQCSTTTQPTNNCSSGDVINSFTLNSIPSTGSNNTCTNGYISFSTPVWTLTIGQSYTFSATVGSGSWPEGFAIWIDLNNNSMYDLNEEVYASTSWSTSHSGSFTIPTTATAANNVRMRLRCAYYTTISSSQACTNSIGSYGETEDYYVNLVAACPTPVISAQPQNRLSCETASTTFSVTASNASTYQWQVNTGSAWANVSGSVYSGATTNTLALTNLTLNYNNYQYRCIVTGSCNNPVTSNAATLTVNPGVAIISQTISDSICEGANTSVSVTANGSATNYQWQMAVATVGVFSNVPNNPPFSGANAPTLNITSVPGSLGGYLFKCQVTGGLCPSAVSENIPFTVLTSPVFTAGPVNDTIVFGYSAHFSATASSQDVVFYWQASADGINYSNINNNSLYQGVTTPNLEVFAGWSLANWWFRTVIKSTDPACGLYRDTSEPAQLIIVGPNSVGSVTKAGALDITVYPNPASGSDIFVKADHTVAGILQSRVIDKLGRVLYDAPLDLSKNKTAPVSIAQLGAGIYTLQLTDTEGNTQSINFTRQ